MISLAVIAKFFFDNWLGKWIAGVTLAAGMFGIWLLQHDHKVAAKAEEKVFVRSEKAGKEANAKNETVRRSADSPGAFDRLLMDRASCRDC